MAGISLGTARRSRIGAKQGSPRVPTRSIWPLRSTSGRPAGDERVFKLILSPEFGERLDLPRLTREVMSQMEIDLSRKLEWCAVVHTNTAHPHVHVALRGVSERQALRLPRAYIKSGIRDAAENLCTVQLGYRTEMDAISAERREVSEQRFTSLDRVILRAAKDIAW